MSVEKVIYVNQSELNEYYFTLSNSSKIWKFRTSIIHSMDKKIRKEFKTRINDLIKLDGTTHYKFIAKDASIDLKNYLDKFNIILEA